MGEVAIKLGDREVHWKLDDTVTAQILQSMVQTFGPAQDPR